MTNNTTLSGRKVMAIVAVIAAIATLIAIPGFGKTAMTGVIKAALAGVEEYGDTAAKLVSFMFPFLVALSMAAATMLLLLSFPIYRGEYWGRPLAVGMLAIICITGAYIFGPVMVTTSSYGPIAAAFMLLGLIPYFIILLYETSPRKDKLVNFFVFLLLGVTTATGFTNGFSGMHKYQGATGGDPSIIITGYHYAYAIGIPIEWTGAVLVVIGIPLLAGRVRAGWWLTTGGTLAILFGTIVFHLAHPNNFFLAGIVVTLITLVVINLPTVIQVLLDGENRVKDQFVPPLGM